MGKLRNKCERKVKKPMNCEENKIISVKSNRECFFDDYLLDSEKTTAKHLLHHPQKKEMVMLCDKPWEGDYCGYFNFFFDKNYHGFDGSYTDGVYRMYYLGRRSGYSFSKATKEDVAGGVVVCYAESADGINWIKPNLNLFGWNGNFENNIVLDKTVHPDIDNFYVFYDENPDCPADERYKGIGAYDEPKGPNGELNEFRLYSFLSADGIHFRMGNMLTNKGFFDSLNIIMWDEEAKKYRGYVRGLHKKGEDPAKTTGNVGAWDKTGGAIKKETNSAGGKMPQCTRAIMYIESEDFKSWSEPVFLRYSDGREFQMYTNGISKYFRAPNIYIGIATRYVERLDWTGNYDQLCGLEKRKGKITEGGYVRFGTSLTDCVFMTSRDGLSFTRYPNAFMRPGAESGKNWTYGDCYPTPMFAITPSSNEGAADEMSFYCGEDYGMGNSSQICRYTLRLDGFVSLSATDKEEKIVTKKFVYEGDNLYINFSTSAMGYMYFTLIDEHGNRFESCETFGDSVERKVIFDEGVVTSLSGKAVTMEIRMFDADIYSMQFAE